MRESFCCVWTSERSANKIAVLRDLVRDYEQELRDAFVVATEDRVRFG
jgi:hypothetical protein